MSSTDRSTAADGSATTTTTIQLDTMSLEQLDQLKQREENRLQALAQRFAALRQAAARLSAAAMAVKDLYATGGDKDNNNQKDADRGDAMETEALEEESKDVFVPLTESVYVPGKIKMADEALLIELGTGYFVEKNVTGTVEFLQRKLQLVDANSENVSQAVQATRQNLESIAVAMQGKLIEIQARQQGQRNREAVEAEN